MKDKIFGVLQRVGRSFMLPIALLPVAGLLLGIGSSFTNETMLAAYGLNSVIHTDPSHCRFKAAACFNSNAKPRVMQEVWGIFAEKRIFMQGRGGRLRLDKGTAQRYNKCRKRHCDKRLVSFKLG